jgi:hypothetical protein
MRIDVSQAEYRARRLGEDKVAAAAQAILDQGYVVLGGAVDPATLAATKSKLDADTLAMLRRAGVEASPGHISQPMPRSPDHVFADVVANPLLIQVTARLLGDGLHNHFYNCNTNMPGSDRQALHRDAPYLWPDPIHPVISVVINIAPVAVDEVNGAIELWPGTHRILGSTGVGEMAEAERRAVVPPVRVVTAKGDAVLRDPRLWHRGMPNLGTEPRHMIAMVHSKGFYRSETRIAVTRAAAPIFDDEILATPLEIVDDDYDYLSEIVRARGW